MDMLRNYAHSILGLSTRMQALTCGPLPQPSKVYDRSCRLFASLVLTSSRLFASASFAAGNLCSQQDGPQAEITTLPDSASRCQRSSTHFYPVRDSPPFWLPLIWANMECFVRINIDRILMTCTVIIVAASQTKRLQADITESITARKEFFLLL